MINKVKVYDNFINDYSLLDEIKNDKNFFPETKKLPLNTQAVNLLDGSPRIDLPYFFWDGWKQSEADTLKKRVIQYIWERILPCNIEDVYGFEYWTRSYLPGQYSDWHLDRGFGACETAETTKGVHAEFGCVYYPDFAEEDSSCLQLYIDGNIFDIEYKPNRLILFNPSNTGHKTTPTIKSIRYSFPINVWLKSNPPTNLNNYYFNYE